MVCLEIVESGERRKLDDPVWVRRQKNGVIVRCHRVKAQGVGDGDAIWSLGELEGFPAARIIPYAEYLERPGPVDSDPELTDTQALDIIMGGTYEAE